MSFPRKESSGVQMHILRGSYREPMDFEDIGVSRYNVRGEQALKLFYGLLDLSFGSVGWRDQRIERSSVGERLGSDYISAQGASASNSQQ